MKGLIRGHLGTCKWKVGFFYPFPFTLSPFFLLPVSSFILDSLSPSGLPFFVPNDGAVIAWAKFG